MTMLWILALAVVATLAVVSAVKLRADPGFVGAAVWRRLGKVKAPPKVTG